MATNSAVSGMKVQNLDDFSNQIGALMAGLQTPSVGNSNKIIAENA